MNNLIKIEKKSVTQKTIEYHSYFNNDPESTEFITITDWANGEGYDISFGDEKIISLTHQQIEKLICLHNA